MLKTEVLLELLGDDVVVELDDGVTFGVPLGSLALVVGEPLGLLLLGVGATVPNTGPVRVGEPVEVGVPVGVGVPVDFIGLGVVVLGEVLVGVGGAVVVLVVDVVCVGTGTFGRGAMTGAPGSWVRVLGGTSEGTRVA